MPEPALVGKLQQRNGLASVRQNWSEFTTTGAIGRRNSAARILEPRTEEGLTRRKRGLKYRKFRENLALSPGDLPDYDFKADPFSSKRKYEAAL
jgi:hypothetical protein